MAAPKKKTSTRSNPKKAASADSRKRRARPAAQPPGVRVRMYRQGFGDCLLVELPGDKGEPFRLLIDCGVLWGTPDATGRMRKVVESLIADTGGHETGGFVDVLAVTHEHWDHVSGFAQAHDLFSTNGRAKGKLAVGEVWLAWTEDPADRLANLLRAERQQQLRSLIGFVEGLRAAGPLAALPLASGVANVLGYFALSATATADALDIAKSLAPNRYFRPSDPPWQSERASGVRIYALGPPPDAKKIRRLTSQSELYHQLAGTTMADAFFAAAARRFGIAMDAETAEQQALQIPFDRTEWLPLDGDGLTAEIERVRTPEEVAKLRTFFAEHYWGSGEDDGSDQSWRRIDDDWLGAATELALHLDAATNNTSLVLAIELVQSRKVLLFAADAQLGNWLSWHDLEWKLDGDTVVKGRDLIERTVFYKVGHHGSHNASLKDKGVELMRTEGFVAFVPVDAETAASRNWHRIPFPPLMEALASRGEVVRSDLGAAEASALRQTDMYVEYTVPL